MTEEDRTPREKEILQKMRREKGDEWVDEHEELILAQAEMVGEI